MDKISDSEKILMNILWRFEKATFKHLKDNYPDPKPAVTTIATYLKRLKNKNFIDYKISGNSREYFALIDKDNYLNFEIKKNVDLFYKKSTSEFLIMIIKTSNLPTEDIVKLIDSLELKLLLEQK